MGRSLGFSHQTPCLAQNNSGLWAPFVVFKSHRFAVPEVNFWHGCSIWKTSVPWSLSLWKQQHPNQPDIHQRVCVIQLRSCFAVALCSHSLLLPTEHCWRAGSTASASVARHWSSSLTEAHCSRFLSKETFLCWTHSLLWTLWHAAQRRSG